MTSLCLFCAISVVKMAYDKTKKWNKTCHMKPEDSNSIGVIIFFLNVYHY